MKTKTIHLEDQGQDLLRLLLDENDRVITTEPINIEFLIGAIVPKTIRNVGEKCPTHRPPDIINMPLRYKVTKIESHE